MLKPCNCAGEAKLKIFGKKCSQCNGMLKDPSADSKNKYHCIIFLIYEFLESGYFKYKIEFFCLKTIIHYLINRQSSASFDFIRFVFCKVT